MKEQQWLRKVAEDVFDLGGGEDRLEGVSGMQKELLPIREILADYVCLGVWGFFKIKKNKCEIRSVQENVN